MLSRFVPSGHPALAALDLALGQCNMALLETAPAQTGSHPAQELNAPFQLPDEHIDGGPLAGPMYVLADPPNLDLPLERGFAEEALTPRTEGEFETWK